MSVREWLIGEAEGGFDRKKAYALCRRLARVHVLPTAESFGWADRYVGVPLMPRLVARGLQRHVEVLCAFTRLLRKVPRDEDGARLIACWRELLSRRTSGHPVLAAAGYSMEELELPLSPYEDLLEAAWLDCRGGRLKTCAEMLDFCGKSANPVGRLILMIHGYRDSGILEYSDDIFTAFHLTTLLRNVGDDARRDRVYLPSEDFEKFGYSEADLRMQVVNERYRNLIKSHWKSARALYERGKPLFKRVHWPLSWQIKLKWLRGNLLLGKIRRYGFDTLYRRPRLKKWDWPRLLGGVLLP